MKNFQLFFVLLTTLTLGVTNAWAEEYALYSGTITEGDYIIVSDGNAMNNTVTSSRLGNTAVTVTSDKISNPDATIIWHIAPSGNYWTIYNEKANKYAASTGAKNKAQLLDSGTDNKSLWTVTGSTSYEFVNKANETANVNKNLRRNGNYGFACYATSTGSALSLYKKVEQSSGGETPDPTPVTVSLNKTELNLQAGATETLIATVTGSTESVTWSSSATGVASVDNTGKVTAVAAGEATITAAIGDVKATCAVTVTATTTPEEPGTGGEETWTLVTNASDLKAGDEVVITSKDADYALSTNQKTSNRAGVAITKNGNTITISNDVQILTLEETGDATVPFALNTGNGYLYAGSSSGNQLKTKTTLDAHGKWAISITDDVASIAATTSTNRNVMQYNYNNGSPLFACYSSASQTALAIYKKVTSTDEPDSEEPILSSIEISGDLTDKTYEEGEELDFSGLTVQANYKNGDPKDVTNEVEWSYTPNPLTIGTTSVTVTATYQEQTATKSIGGLTVKEHVVIPGEYGLLLNNVFFGTTAGTNVSSFPTSAKQNDIIVTLNGSGEKTQTDAANVRMYEDNTLTFAVPTGYLIKTIVFTEPTSNKQWKGSITANVGTYTDGSKSWSGNAQEVIFSFGAKNRIATAIVTYIKDVKYAINITTPSNGTLVVKEGEKVLTPGAEIYEGTELTVTTTPDPGYTDGVVVVKNSSEEDITSIVYADGTLTMPAYPITVSATFERKPCSLLSTPTVSATTTYNSATLTWEAVANAAKYSVQIGTTEAVETTETSYEVTGLKADTQYTYHIQAIAADDQSDYCDSELAEGSFTTSQAPIATLILSENGETHDLDGEHRLYEIITLPNTAATCTKTFVGWSANANCTTAPEYAPGAEYKLAAETQTLYAVYATTNGAETKYIKLTTTPTPSFAGTYLIVNEENKVAFNGGLETLDVARNTISVEITDATIPSCDATENSTFTIYKNQEEEDNNYFIISKSKKYIGKTKNDNGLDEDTKTAYTNTISIDADGNANIIGSGGAYLRYNDDSNQKRFRYYKSTSYTSQEAIALYKKYSIPLYTNYTTYCGDDITISSGTTQTFNTDQQINTLIIEGGATANLVAGNIEINTIILKGGLNADATDYKMPILYTNGATIDVDHLYLNLAINHNTYYPFAVPFPVSVSDIDYANPTLAAASEYGTHYLIKRYDGAERAKNGVNKDVNWVVVETDETLQPGVGYIISALTGNSETTTTIQIPLTFVPEQNSTLSIPAHTGAAAANDPIHKGWNFIAHPYLSKYAGNNINNAPRYVSIPTYNFSAYQQKKLEFTTLSPEYPFFVQIGDTTEINFTTQGRLQTPASVRAEENNQILNLLFKILLADEEKDQTGIILDNNCTPAYEIDADLEKMFGSAFTTSIYTLCQDMRLAFNAMSFENAQSSPIPLGYRAAEAGEYTINLDIIEDASAYEHLYDGIVLYDSATESQTNLLYADYTFTTDKIQDDTRFSVQFVPKNNAPTHIENIPHYQTTQKIILNNQLYIIHNGQIYNITGQNIR